MNPRQLKILAIVLGAAVLLSLPRLLQDSESEGSVNVGDGFAFGVAADSVEGVDIVLAGDADTVRLKKVGDEWTVDGYAADEFKTSDLLDEIESLSSRDIVARNPEHHGDLGVGDDGRRIEVHVRTGEMLRFHLGERDLRSGGYFVRLPGEVGVFRLDGSAGGYLSRERDAWRPRLIASTDSAGLQEIVLRRADRATVLRRSDDGWMAGETPADSAAVERMLASLNSLSASGFPTEEEEAAADFSAPDASIEVFSTVPELSLLLLSDEERGDWLARRSEGGEAYRLASFAVDRLLPEALLPDGD